MIKRLQQVFHKFLFCYDSTADLSSFFKLIVNTKKYKNSSSEKILNDSAVQYRLKFNNQHKTITLRTYSGDIGMLYEIFWQKVYQKVIHKDAGVFTIVDIGANIGMASLFFSQYYPDASIYAIEPDSDNFEMLTQNLSQEIHKGNLIPVKAAITDKDGDVYIQKRDYAYNSFVTYDETSDHKVKAYSMPSFLYEMRIGQIDILKIDIEGMEEKLFSANTDWLEIVQTIVVECHSATAMQLCKNTLTAYGFSIVSEGSLLIGNKIIN